MFHARAHFCLFMALLFLTISGPGASAPAAETELPPKVVGGVGGAGGVTVIHMGGGSPPVPVPSSRAQAASAAGAVNSAVGGAAEDVAAEIERAKSAQTGAWNSLNQLNPFSATAGKVPLSSGEAALTGPFEQLTKLLNQPAVQGYLKLFSNPTFAKGVDQIVQSPRRMTLLYVQIGFIIFMMFFRAWRFSKSVHWLKRFWTQIWTFGMYWVGAAIVIPWVVLGDAYYQTVAGLLDVLLTSMKN